MDGTNILTRPQPNGLPGGLPLGMIASSVLWLLIAALPRIL